MFLEIFAIFNYFRLSLLDKLKTKKKQNRGVAQPQTTHNLTKNKLEIICHNLVQII